MEHSLSVAILCVIMEYCALFITALCVRGISESRTYLTPAALVLTLHHLSYEFPLDLNMDYLTHGKCRLLISTLTKHRNICLKRHK